MKSIVLTAAVLMIILITSMISFAIFFHAQNIAAYSMNHQTAAGITLSTSNNNYYATIINL